MRCTARPADLAAGRHHPLQPDTAYVAKGAAPIPSSLVGTVRSTRRPSAHAVLALPLQGQDRLGDLQMRHIRFQTINWPANPPRSRAGHLLALLLLVVTLSAGVLTAAATQASATAICDPGSDTCVVSQDTRQTPLGPVTITVSTANVVT